MLSLIISHDDLHTSTLYRKIVKGEKHNQEEEYNDFINAVKITPPEFMKLCPALLAQIDNAVCMEPAPLSSHQSSNLKERIWNGKCGEGTYAQSLN